MNLSGGKSRLCKYLTVALTMICGATFVSISGFSSKPPSQASSRRVPNGICIQGPNSTCLPPFVRKQPLWLVSQEHKLAVCKIEKVMSTFMTATVCYLNRTEQFLSVGRKIHSEVWPYRFCGNSIEYSGALPVAKSDDSTFVVVARDPISRFMSGWMDKCIRIHDLENPRSCYDCHKNMTCFVEELYRRANEFVQHKRVEDFEMQHFLPQNWYCPISDFPFQLVKFGNTDGERVEMKKRIQSILQTTNVTTSQIDYITTELDIKSPHATAASKSDLKSQYLKELLETPRLWRRFMELYYYDFTLFGFELPVESDSE